MASFLFPHERYVWLVAASTIAGVMNAMAGGGSFLSFPAMLGMGVPPIQANATNTVALWPGQLTSLATLRGDVRRDLLPTIAITSVIGGVSGAEVLLHTRGETLVFGASGPVSRWLRRRASHPHEPAHIPQLALAAALFPVCFYIG